MCFPFILLSFMKLQNRKGIESRSTQLFCLRCQKITLRFQFHFYIILQVFLQAKSMYFFTGVLLFICSASCHLAFIIYRRKTSVDILGNCIEVLDFGHCTDLGNKRKFIIPLRNTLKFHIFKDLGMFQNNYKFSLCNKPH